MTTQVQNFIAIAKWLYSIAVQVADTESRAAPNAKVPTSEQNLAV